MIYVQQFFSLMSDRLVFGVSPTLLSIIGSSLVLGSAAYVALKSADLKEAAQRKRDGIEAEGGIGADGVADEERGLIEGMDVGDEDAYGERCEGR